MSVKELVARKSVMPVPKIIKKVTRPQLDVKAVAGLIDLYQGFFNLAVD